MGSIYQIVLRLSPALPYVLIGIILFILSILTVLFFIFRSARKKAPPEEAGEEIAQAAEEDREEIPPPITPVSTLGLRKSFSRATSSAPRLTPVCDPVINFLIISEKSLRI